MLYSYISCNVRHVFYAKWLGHFSCRDIMKYHVSSSNVSLIYKTLATPMRCIIINSNRGVEIKPASIECAERKSCQPHNLKRLEQKLHLTVV